jgi:hypothetical protein
VAARIFDTAADSDQPEIRQETDEALALTGKDVGTPIIQFQPPAGAAFFGPVISRLPSAAEAVPLWDNVLGLVSFPGFAELKRSLRERPHLRSFGVETGQAGVQEDWYAGRRARSGIALRSRGSRRGEDVGLLDVRVLGQQAGTGLAERGRDRAVQVRLPAALVAEGVENAEGGIGEPEGVPGDRAGLGRSQRLGLGQEGGELVFLARLGLEDNE